jgi:hypothetical protein
MLRRIWVLSAIVFSAFVQPSALAVFCGNPPSSGDHRFDAVCALQRRDEPPEGTYVPRGSGVLVTWTAPGGTIKTAILSVRHFIDTNGTPGGGCNIQQNLWYAYFRGCPVQSGPSTCASICYGPNEDLIRVRISCFTLAAGEFAGLSAGADGVVVGEIDPADMPYLCNITPMTILNPVELGCIMGYEAFIAG